MAKVLYTDFEDTESIISRMMDNPALKKAVTRTNLYTFWNSILPEKYRKKSRPYGMLPQGIMIIACQNPVIAQELSLHKIILLNKFTPYAKSMNINLKDFKFDPKKWVS